jgi:predicted O-methyltransferase YrrM
MRDAIKGRVDYYLRPRLRSGAELYSLAYRGLGPMNGQPSRQEATRQLMARVRPPVIVETGTYRGVTTEFLADFGVPVHTIEIDARLHAYSRARLRRYRNVTVHLGDSVEVLQSLDPQPSAFFYLDAHWNSEGPLVEELAEIFTRWPKAVVMIDDFQVPGDSYSWMDCGPGKELVSEILGVYEQLPRWYPTQRAYQEAGCNTGWTIVAPAHEEILDKIPELRH